MPQKRLAGICRDPKSPRRAMDSDEDLLLALADEDDAEQAQAEVKAEAAPEPAQASKAPAKRPIPSARKRPRGGTPGRAPPRKVAARPDPSTPSLAVRGKWLKELETGHLAADEPAHRDRCANRAQPRRQAPPPWWTSTLGSKSAGRWSARGSWSR